MLCPHCKKEYDDSFKYCPYCAEPKPERVQTLDEKINEKDKSIWAIGLGVIFIAFIPNVIIGYVISIIVYLLTPLEDMYDVNQIYESAVKIIDSEKIFTIAAIVSAVIGLLYVICWKLKSRRGKMIDIQFSEDQTSICPQCGSHNIALGRKGYNWKEGYRNSVLDIKGGFYLAGMDSRRVTAHCQNCGHSWLTNREWLE